MALKIMTCMKMDVEPDVKVQQSPYDKKRYRAITLDNGIRALLISDQRNGLPNLSENTFDADSVPNSDQEEESSDEELSDSLEEVDDSLGVESVDGDSPQRRPRNRKTQQVRSACGVCVATGSICDPPEIQGMAHLLEHMVFMGSAKYPGENTFDSFTSKHGGYENASTDYERTMFQFCIQPQYFKEGLDMFAHFFASPSLLRESLDREIEAVDNEFQTAVQTDRDRVDRLLATLARSEHPLKNFVWGNEESLKKIPKQKKINLCKSLRDYYKRHYSSHYMTVVVMSCYPLDTLEDWTRESYSAVPNNGLPCPSMADHKDVFDKDLFTKLYKVVPVKETHKLKLTWVLPPQLDLYKEKPAEYISWLLGHEGEGSVFTELRKRHLATSLAAGTSGVGLEYNSAFSLFSCDITLTDKGMTEILQCITLVFQYIKMLQDVGPQERVFREIQEIHKNEFDFSEDEEPFDTVESLCESMQLYPVEHYLTGGTLFYSYDPTAISSLLSQLSPEEANIMILSPANKQLCSQTEKWFGTSFSMEDVPCDWKTSWKNLELNPKLHLPGPNPFIASEFSIKEPDGQSKYPVLIQQCSEHALWYKSGSECTTKLPLAWVCLALRSPLCLQSPENTMLMSVFVFLICENVSELSYSGSVVKLDLSITSHHSGLLITVDGLNHKLELFFKELVEYFVNFNTSEESFQTAKEHLKKSLNNQLIKPKKLCKESRLKVLESTHWTFEEKLATLGQLSLSSLEEFVVKFKKQLFVEALVQGNLSAQEAREIVSHFSRRLNYTSLSPNSQALTRQRTVQLPARTQVCYRRENKNPQSTVTVLTHYYQCCRWTVRDIAMVELLAAFMNEPCFNELRTKQQLGYEVYVQDHNTHGMVGLSLTLVTQATKFSSEYASQCMDQFVLRFHEQLSTYSPQQFKEQVEALIQEKREPPISLQEEVVRNWAEFQAATYCFDLPELTAAQLETVSQAELCDWLHNHTHPGPGYRRLSVEVVSQQESVTCQSSPHDSCPQSSNHTTQESSVDPPLANNLKQQVVSVSSEEIEKFKSQLFICPVISNNSTL